MGEVSGKADGIARGLGEVSGKADGIARRVGKIETGIEAMTESWGCVSPSCLGTVRFPHNEPDLLDKPGDAKCGWKGGNIPIPTKMDLDDIVGKLKGYPPMSIWVLGHASVLGPGDHNSKLSERRAKFVKCHLKNKDLKQSFIACAAGEKESRNSLRFPDFRYRLVEVFSGSPLKFLPNSKEQFSCEQTNG